MWRFPKMGVPLVIIHFHRMFPYKTIQLLGYPHLWKPPFTLQRGRGEHCWSKTKVLASENMINQASFPSIHHYHQPSYIPRIHHIIIYPSISIMCILGCASITFSGGLFRAYFFSIWVITLKVLNYYVKGLELLR